MSRISLTCILVVQVLLAQSRPANAVPTFADYRVGIVSARESTGTPKLTTPEQRRFRTAIRQAAAKGPNFAGHFTIAAWGCGTGCIQFVVVDNQS